MTDSMFFLLFGCALILMGLATVIVHWLDDRSEQKNMRHLGLLTPEEFDTRIRGNDEE